MYDKEIYETLNSQRKLNERLSMLETIKPLDKKSLWGYYKLNYKNSLREMAKINAKDFSFFPYNKFDIRIWSNDHNPPHFHVISNGWDIIVGIEDGQIMRVKKIGKDSKIYSYVEKNINDWLDCKSVRYTNHTNREVAMNTWEDVQAPPLIENLTEEEFSSLILKN